MKVLTALSARLVHTCSRVLATSSVLRLFFPEWEKQKLTLQDLQRLSHAVAINREKLERNYKEEGVVEGVINEVHHLAAQSIQMEKFLDEARRYGREAITSGFMIPLEKDYIPCLNDKTPSTGFDRHYLYHPIWALRKLKEIKPDKHIDISSTLFFSAAASLFCDVEFYDYRPADIELPNLRCSSADLLKLEFADESVTSLSCMHVIEHIGLGRYGDPIDPSGAKKAAKELTRVLARNGDLLVVLPFGRTKVAFNAHRIYSLEDVKALFSELTLKEFTLISEHPSDGGLINNPSDEMLLKQTYGCGCYWFKK